MTATPATGRPAVHPLERSGLDRRRALVDRFFRALCVAASVVCIVPLAAIVLFVVLNGIAALNLDLLTKPPRALGTGGGALSPIPRALPMVALAPPLAKAVGPFAGLYGHQVAGGRAARGRRLCPDG